MNHARPTAEILNAEKESDVVNVSWEKKCTLMFSSKAEKKSPKLELRLVYESPPLVLISMNHWILFEQFNFLFFFLPVMTDI